MVGTIINVATIIAGTFAGISIGARLSDQVRDIIISGLGLFTFGYGLMSFLETAKPLVPLAGLLIGALLGEWWKIEERLETIGIFLEHKVIPSDESPQKSTHKFVEGFVTASLMFLIGPMAILGSIQDGLTGNAEMLIIKAILDGFASIAFASTFGVGVVFSGLVVLAYQGSITLLAGFFSSIFSSNMITEMTAVGGLILMALAISTLLGLRKIRIGSFLPGLLITPLIVVLIEKYF